MKVNMSMSKRISPYYTTHEGAPAKRINYEQQLRRSVLACLLWENQFYEEGEDIASRISALVPKVAPEVVAELAVTAREKMKLRHVPLLLVREMARLNSHKHLVAETLARVIQRPDELTEFLAIYWKEKKQPLSSQVKKGLAQAFCKFDEYQLAKYNRNDAIKLRDVMFLSHPKPQAGYGGDCVTRKYKNGTIGTVSRHDEGQGLLWRKLINNELETPYTWEVELTKVNERLTETEREEVTKLRQQAKGHKINSAAIETILKPYKAEIWKELLLSRKLGALAVLRNLRNMQEAGVETSLIAHAIDKANIARVLPYRFITAARYAPDLEPVLETAMLKCLTSQEPLPGRTMLLVDVSGSMDQPMASRQRGNNITYSQTMRIDAACGLAILLRQICEEPYICSFSERLIKVPLRSGFALRDAIVHSQHHSSTYLGRAIREIENSQRYDRLIVITDEQSHDSVPDPQSNSYIINVASYRNGVGYGKYNHIDGFSEAVIDWIREYEKLPGETFHAEDPVF